MRSRPPFFIMKIKFLILFMLLIPSFCFATTWTLKETGSVTAGYGAIAYYKYTGYMYFCSETIPTAPWQASDSYGTYAVARDYCESGNHGQLGSANQPGRWYYLDVSGSTLQLWESSDYSPDSDGDGVLDGNDNCADTPTGETVDSNGCTEDQLFCHNDSLDDGELGKDCGGICTAVCIATCPPGTDSYTDSEDNVSCVQEVLADNYGNCPDLVNWYYYSGSAEAPNTPYCSKITDAYLSVNVATLPAVQDPWTRETTSSTSTSIATVDNGDGTSTRTTTETTTEPDGGISQSSTVDTIDNATGSVTNTTINNSTSTTNPDSAWSEDTKKTIEAIEGLTEELSDSLEADILSGVDSATTAATDNYFSQITDEFTVIQGEYDADPDTWISSETVTGDVQSILPDSQTCQDVKYTLTNGRDVTISCYAMNKIKTLLGYIFAVLTLVYIYDLIFRQDIVKD